MAKLNLTGINFGGNGNFVKFSVDTDAVAEFNDYEVGILKQAVSKIVKLSVRDILTQAELDKVIEQEQQAVADEEVRPQDLSERVMGFKFNAFHMTDTVRKGLKPLVETTK